MQLIWLRENFWGVQAWEVHNRKIYRGGFPNLGRTGKYYVLAWKLLSTSYPMLARPGWPILNL